MNQFKLLCRDVIVKFTVRSLTLTPPINAQMPQNWSLGADSEGVKVEIKKHKN